MVDIKKCPIETALQFIGKKWTFEIVRDLFFGKTRFNEFLDANPGLTSKVLSQRLKELRENEIIEKIVKNSFPITVEYNLTERGKKLNKILYELAEFSFKICPEYKEDYAKQSLNLLKKELNIT